MNDYVVLLLGVGLAAAGGEVFVRGAVALAGWLRIAPGLVAATVAAFATSAPELAVSIRSATQGYPQIALGDALGSNVVNIALILALSLAIATTYSRRDALRRDFPVALAVPVLTSVLVLDGGISRLDAGVMLLGFAGWLLAVVAEARRQRRNSDPAVASAGLGKALLLAAAGMGLLAAAAQLIVAGARGIALDFGVEEFAIGATLVALGTSAPELATALAAKLRGHDDVSLGALLGSNIFNGLFIVPVAALIHPITVGWGEVLFALVCGFGAIALCFPARDGRIGRWRSAPLIVLYLVFSVSTLIAGGPGGAG